MAKTVCVGTPWWTDGGRKQATSTNQRSQQIPFTLILLITMWWVNGSTEVAAAGLACSWWCQNRLKGEGTQIHQVEPSSTYDTLIAGQKNGCKKPCTWFCKPIFPNYWNWTLEWNTQKHLLLIILLVCITLKLWFMQNVKWSSLWALV